MSRRTFLVTGATGDTGGATVEQALTFATPSAPGSFRLLPSSPRPPGKPALHAW
jgi:uncharacterized protein YbjT (DUF2867 family)